MVAEMSVTISKKNQPIWSDDKSAESWKAENEMWLVITDIQVKKRAPTIMLTLQCRKREVAKQIPIGDLNHEDGVTRLFAKLEEYFAKDTVDSAYEAYVKFEEPKRQPASSNADYILESETAYQKIEKLEMKLSDSVQACKLLHGACLQTSERQMVLATTKTLKVSDMRGTLKRIFCDALAQTAADVKEEPFSRPWMPKTPMKSPHLEKHSMGAFRSID